MFGLSFLLVPVVHDTVGLRNKKFVRFTCFVFPCAQLVHLDAQQRRFSPHHGYRISSSGVDGAGNLCIIGRAIVAAD